MMHIDTQLLALLCGHFCGDFILQTEKIVVLKQAHSTWMCFHAATVALVTWLFLGNLSAWWIMAIIAATHLLIDTFKIRLHLPGKKSSEDAHQGAPLQEKQDFGPKQREQAQSRAFFWFMTDQLLHLIVLCLLWSLLRDSTGSLFSHNAWSILWGVDYTKALLLLTGLALGVFAVGVVVKMQMDTFTSTLTAVTLKGLPKGGKTIGVLERLLVFLFVLAGKPEGIGFIVAAKSVFRIGDLTNREDREQAEYIMIGTLRSFTYALVFAFTTQWLLKTLH